MCSNASVAPGNVPCKVGPISAVWGPCLGHSWKFPLSLLNSRKKAYKRMFNFLCGAEKKVFFSASFPKPLID